MGQPLLIGFCLYYVLFFSLCIWSNSLPILFQNTDYTPGTWHRTDVHLENPEYHTRWYFKYFLGKGNDLFVNGLAFWSIKMQSGFELLLFKYGKKYGINLVIIHFLSCTENKFLFHVFLTWRQRMGFCKRQNPCYQKGIFWNPSWPWRLYLSLGFFTHLYINT